jgi:hypothetical protein
MSGVYGVNRSEVRSIRQPKRGLHDLGHARPCRLEDGGKLVQGLLRLRFDSIGELLCGRVDSDLARAEEQATAIDRLAVGPDCRRRVSGRDGLPHYLDG